MCGLSASGKVERVVALKNTVAVDPQLVFRCIHDAFMRLTLPPPRALSRHFRMTLRFSDAC